MEQIIAQNLKKTYLVKEKASFFKRPTIRTVEAVKDVSLNIPKGKIIGLLGVNGAGKTTTIRMLCAIIEPTSGTLTIDNVDAIKNYMSVKSKINMITGGERNIYWRLTARENLRYFGSLYNVEKKELEKRVEDLLTSVDLIDAADMPVERYSKGMKQRLQIARGLVNDPDYLFLDEPTLGLDIIIAKEMRSYIKRLAVEHNKGLLLTTHYIAEAGELCDYIYVISKGLIIASGTKEELGKLFITENMIEINVDPISEGQEKSIINALQAYNTNLSIKYDSETSAFTVAGNELDKSEILSVLISGGLEIISVNKKEENLEDIIYSIISKNE